MDDRPMQGPATEPKSLVDTVISCLREDINIPYGEGEVRQPPINEDDHDSWASAKDRENWRYVAESVIQTIDRYRAKL